MVRCWATFPGSPGRAQRASADRACAALSLLGDLLNECQRDRLTPAASISLASSPTDRVQIGQQERGARGQRARRPAGVNRPSGGEQRLRTSAQAEAKVLVCHPTDDALCLELTQALQGEDEIDIA